MSRRLRGLVARTALLLLATPRRARGFVAGPLRASPAARRPVLRSTAQPDTAATPLEPPPQTMAQCLQQAQAAVGLALDDGAQLLEVEYCWPHFFRGTRRPLVAKQRRLLWGYYYGSDAAPPPRFPPLPAATLEASETSASDVARANTELAVSFSAALAKSRSYEKVVVLYPDAAEAERAVEDLGTDAPRPGVLLRGLRKPWTTAVGFDQLFLAAIGRGTATIAPVDGADLYVCLTFSAQELPDLEALFEATNATTPLVFFNLKLDTQRGDLGLPAFPSKDLQWRFLSRVKPAYYLRTRQYSMSMPGPPFVVNYQGALFRVYPGPFQSLLDTGSTYRPVGVDDVRPALGTFKQTLTDALQLSSAMTKGEQFARSGYKAVTWWEEDKDRREQYSDWRN